MTVGTHGAGHGAQKKLDDQLTISMTTPVTTSTGATFTVTFMDGSGIPKPYMYGEFFMSSNNPATEFYSTGQTNLNSENGDAYMGSGENVGHFITGADGKVDFNFELGTTGNVYPVFVGPDRALVYGDLISI